MKKKAERIVAGILSISMLMSICSTSVLAETVDLGESTPTTTTYVLDPDRVVTLESMGGAPVAPVALGTDPADPAADPADDPVADPEPSLKVEVDEDDGSVDVTVEDRPEATPANPDTEWHPSLEITGEDAEELGKEEISASADGEEHFTSEGPVKDGADRVIQDDQTIEGSEKIETTVTEEVKKDPEGTDGPIDTVESDKVGADGEGVTVEANPNDPTESASKSETWDMSEGDLRDLVEKPTAPSEDDGWVAKDENTSTKSNTTTAEDGTVTKTEETWTRNEYKDTVDGQPVAGYMETTTVETTETGAIDPDLSKKPADAKDITDENDRVGYTYTTVEVDEQGVRTETTYTVFPEQGTYSKTTTTTTTKLTYAKQTEKGTITISNVIASEGDKHGQLGTMTGPKTDTSLDPSGKDVNMNTDLRDYYHDYVFGGSGGAIANGNFYWIYGIEDGKDLASSLASRFDVECEQSTSTPNLYVIRDKDGNEYHVYCADRGQSLGTGAGVQYDLENLKDSGYFDTGDWRKIEEVAVNGYWGVKNEAAAGEEPTYGSLDDFRNMLVDSGEMSRADANKITEGMALAVTQAAIWKYGSASGNTTVEKPFQTQSYKNPLSGPQLNPDGSYKRDDDGNILFEPWLLTKEIDSVDQALMEKAYEILTDKAEATVTKTETATGTEITTDKSSSTDLIGKEDITNVKVTVNSKLKEASDDGKDLYNTDLSFTLEVEPSRINSDDLQVTVTIGDQKVTYTLPKAAGDGETVGRTDNTYADGTQDVTYILKGITLPDGTNVSINLTGTQSLGKSAYLLTAKGENGETDHRLSQSFVGVYEGTRNVNVDVSFTFEAEQPEATVYIETTEEQVVEQTQQTSWSSSWLSKIFYLVKPTEPDEPTPDKPKEDPKKPEPEEPDSPDGEPQDGAFVIYPENTDNVIMPEENKKRVESVPKTGDDASVWMIMGLLSMAGLVVINLPKKKMEH